MDGLMHPVGPEQERTYWVRRAVVVGVLLLLLLAVSGLVRAIGGGAEQAATPEPAAAVATPTPSPALPPPPTETAKPEAPATPVSTASPRPVPTTEIPAPGAANGTPTGSAATATAGATAAASATASGGTCAPSSLRVGLEGPRQVQAGSPVTLQVSVTNTGSAACAVDISAKTFTLQVVSGPDRVWSTQDCTNLVRAQRSTVQPNQSTDFTVQWSGKRSTGNCQSAADPLRSGTYTASAQLAGATQDQVTMQLRG